MKYKPLTKAMFESGMRAHPPCLGEPMFLSIKVNGAQTLGPCTKCYDWRQCSRTKLGIAEEADTTMVMNNVPEVR